MSDFINEGYIRKAIETLKSNGRLFEIRIIDPNRKGATVSGYFSDADTLINQLKRVNLRQVNVYITLNKVNEGCYSRVQRDVLRAVKSGTTSDSDIDGYDWLFIDFDPQRPTGVSSSKDELQSAADLASKVYKYLQGLGFEEPVKALSGNGYHLLYKIKLLNTPQNIELVKNCMETISTMFSNDKVKIDTTTTNPSRICKLYGTLAQKGADTEERPHRMSRIFSDNVPKATDIVFLKKLASQITSEEKPAYRETTNGERFDLESFLQKHGITYELRPGAGRQNSDIYALDECPFNPQHKNGDAKIFHYTDGKNSFRCHHDSCHGKRWQDVRLLFEPHAYDHDRTELDAEIESGWKEHNRLKTHIAVQLKPEQPAEMFRTAEQIMQDEEPDHEYIRSGIDMIDTQMHGLQKQCISVISGLRGSGKSTAIGTMILTAVQDNHTVVVYSGQLANKKYLRWLHRQAAGKAHVQVSVKYKNGVGVPLETERMIDKWFGDRFLLYDNRCGNNFSKISEALERILVERHADICIIDNMMALDLAPKNDKYDAQTEFVWKLKNIAQRTNTHIVFVAHPKKSQGYIRLDDISGAGNISNIVDNAFMVHRNNEDFKKKLVEFSQSLYEKLDRKATNFIEIAKDRQNGLQDFFVPLYYEDSTKRLRNSEDENIVYGWVPDQSNMMDVTNNADNEIPW